MSLADFIIACRHCLHLNYGRRFCSECGCKLDVSHITNR